jgi:hypothetical protein
MTTKNQQKTTIENILKLETLKKSLDGPELKKVEEVIDSLRDSVGEVVTKTNASKILQVSRQTLDRWIDKGALPTVNLQGREKIATPVVEKIAKEVEEIRNTDQTRAILADALRRVANDIAPDKTVKKAAAKQAAAKKTTAKKAAAKKTTAKKAAPKKAAPKKVTKTTKK